MSTFVVDGLLGNDDAVVAEVVVRAGVRVCSHLVSQLLVISTRMR